MTTKTTHIGTREIGDCAKGLTPGQTRQAICRLAGIPSLPAPLTARGLLSALLEKIGREDPGQLKEFGDLLLADDPKEDGIHSVMETLKGPFWTVNRLELLKATIQQIERDPSTDEAFVGSLAAN